MTVYAVVSLHDVAPPTQAECTMLIDLVEDHGVRASLLVVPGPWKGPSMRSSSAFVRWLRTLEARGHEIVVHGWEHHAADDEAVSAPFGERVRARVLARGCAEFAHLGRTEARRRAGRSLRVLRDAGCHTRGFVPPGWLISGEAVRGLRDLGLEYTATRSGVLDLVTQTTIDVPAYCQRSGSPLSRPGAAIVDALVATRIRNRRPVRVALHPQDATSAHLRSASARLVRRIAASPSHTYADLVDRQRRSILTRPPAAAGGL